MKIILIDILQKDDAKLASIIRKNLEKYNLDVPGTAYYDSQLDSLSSYYLEDKAKRLYIVAADDDNNAVGGVGLSECSLFKQCAEIEKLYLCDAVKRNGYGKLLIKEIEERAILMGYKSLYLETHSRLVEALKLYNRVGFKEIDKPLLVKHTTMDRFYFKQLNDL
ncbi:MAG: GNAT family N-acetyltransferase [Desulfovibrio sp.]|nr:GNAT family N-acetyltransferase [Desulfovibrio sp.]